MNNFAPMIQIKSVTKSFQISKSVKKIAVNNATLTIENGQRLGIVGKNGAGKSTLLHMIAGLSEPSKGSIEVTGRVTSVMTLGLGLREDLTGRENIYVDGEIQGKTRSEVDKFISEIIQFAELEEFIDYPLRTYSTGMKARLAFSMITSIDPEILIIDEALSAGDAKFSLKATAKIREICERGKIVILVSHGMSSVNEMCNRCIWMDNGQIIADGQPEVITKKYLDTVRQEDEKILQEKFKSLTKNTSLVAGFSVDALSLATAGKVTPRVIFESGEDVQINSLVTIQSGISDCVLKIRRIDGLLLVEQQIPAKLARAISIVMPKLPLGKGTYDLSLSLWNKSHLLAERSTVFEITSQLLPKGGRPALLYPSKIEIMPSFNRESEK